MHENRPDVQFTHLKIQITLVNTGEVYRWAVVGTK